MSITAIAKVIYGVEIVQADLFREDGTERVCPEDRTHQNTSATFCGDCGARLEHVKRLVALPPFAAYAVDSGYGRSPQALLKWMLEQWGPYQAGLHLANGVQPVKHAGHVYCIGSMLSEVQSWSSRTSDAVTDDPATLEKTVADIRKMELAMTGRADRPLRLFTTLYVAER